MTNHVGRSVRIAFTIRIVSTNSEDAISAAGRGLRQCSEMTLDGDYSQRVARPRRYLANAFTVVRWWFGLVYLVAGIGAVVAGPMMMAGGDYGGLYILIGGAVVGALGFVIHPLGVRRLR